MIRWMTFVSVSCFVLTAWAAGLFAQVNANGNSNGVAPHRDGLAHDGLGFGEHGDESERVNGSHRGADVGFSTRIDVEQAAVA